MRLFILFFILFIQCDIVAQEDLLSLDSLFKLYKATDTDKQKEKFENVYNFYIDNSRYACAPKDLPKELLNEKVLTFKFYLPVKKDFNVEWYRSTCYNKYYDNLAYFKRLQVLDIYLNENDSYFDDFYNNLDDYYYSFYNLKRLKWLNLELDRFVSLRLSEKFENLKELEVLQILNHEGISFFPLSLAFSPKLKVLTIRNFEKDYFNNNNKTIDSINFIETDNSEIIRLIKENHKQIKISSTKIGFDEYKQDTSNNLIANIPEFICQYYPNGQLSIQGRVNNKYQPIGKWEFYFANGNLKESRVYKNGEPTGVWQKFNSNGKLVLVRDYLVPGVLKQNSFDSLGRILFKNEFEYDSLGYKHSLKIKYDYKNLHKEVGAFQSPVHFAYSIDTILNFQIKNKSELYPLDTLLKLYLNAKKTAFRGSSTYGIPEQEFQKLREKADLFFSKNTYLPVNFNFFPREDTRYLLNTQAQGLRYFQNCGDGNSFLSLEYHQTFAPKNFLQILDIYKPDSLSCDTNSTNPLDYIDNKPFNDFYYCKNLKIINIVGDILSRGFYSEEISNLKKLQVFQVDNISPIPFLPLSFAYLPNLKTLSIRNSKDDFNFFQPYSYPSYVLELGTKNSNKIRDEYNDFYIDNSEILRFIQSMHKSITISSKSIDLKDIKDDTTFNLIDSISKDVLFNYPSGQPSIVGQLNESMQLDGLWKLYYPDGKIKEERYYKNGDAVGTWNLYDIEGTIRVRYEYLNNEKIEREWDVRNYIFYLYNSKGELIRKERVIRGNNECFVTEDEY
jgi:antitoxin component YwqK of YwqJK toxin-antitoxin module